MARYSTDFTVFAVATLGVALYLATRRQAAPLRSATPGNALDLEELVVTAARLPAPAGDLDEITVTATRLPETTLSRAVDAVTSAAGAVVDAIKGVFVPRGIRNHNPGNLERTGTAWKGMATAQTDPRFIVFSEPKWGVRALGRVLKTYESRGLTTVRAIVNRWAPPTENNTSAYVTSVARALGVAPDATISVTERLPQLAAAIIRHENGINPYSAADLAEWVRLA